MRTAISTDIRLSTSMESQGNLPDLPDDEDGRLCDEPEEGRLQLKDPTGSDVLSDMPVQNGQQDQESDKPPSGTLNGEDERNDDLTQNESVNLRSPETAQWRLARVCQMFLDAHKGIVNRQESYSTPRWVIPFLWLCSHYCRGSVQLSLCHWESPVLLEIILRKRVVGILLQ